MMAHQISLSSSAQADGRVNTGLLVFTGFPAFAANDKSE
jgi:hypothetical protein